MKRREFIGGLAGAAAAWPVAGRAQHHERRIGLLLSVPANDSEYPTLVRAFLEELKSRGWSDGENIKIDTRWASNIRSIRQSVTELLALAPDVVIAPGSFAAAMFLQ